MTSKRRRRMNELGRKGIYILPNLFTTGNLFCGVFALLCVIDKHYVTAAMAIIVGAIFDLLDGKLARITKTTSQFGLEYDSLADVVSFVVVPGFLFYSWGLIGFGQLGLIALFLYVACGAMRLARFNAHTPAVETGKFTGLPSPAAAGLIATFVILDDYILHFGKEIRPIIILGTAYTLAFLMVSTLPYRSFKNLRLKDQKPFSALVITVLALLVIFVAPQVTFFALTSLYVLSGVIEKPATAIYHLVFKEKDRPAIAGDKK
ncbi:MAG: CDP-diacylglycerol--serine O-phosphatidyltransferase [Nitrospirota bacterium]